MFAVAVVALCGGFAADAELTPYRIDRERSVVTFVTFKGGFLSGLVDNVLTTPTEYRIDLQVGSKPMYSRFSIEFDADTMEVNDPETIMKWYRSIHDRKILDKEPGDMGEFKRRRVRKAMLSEKMLDAETFPIISAVTTGIVPLVTPTPEATHRIHFDVTIRDRTVAVDWPAVIVQREDGIEVEVYGALVFSDFGIDPYSTFLGAVKYEDEFQVFAHLKARPAGELLVSAP